MRGSTTLDHGRRDQPVPRAGARPGERTRRQPRAVAADATPEPSSLARDHLLSLSEVVPTIALALGSRAEVVLHDLSRLPNSIVAVGGNLTRRAVGGPMTDLMLRRIRSDHTDDLLRYRVTHGDRIFQASTIFLRHVDGTPYGCLCINIDVTDLVRVNALTESFIGFSDGEARDARDTGDDRPRAAHGVDAQVLSRLGADDTSDSEETYPQTVNELAESVVERSVQRIGIPVSLMRKEHKIEVVRAAEMSGLFLMRAAVDSLARRLEVSRYTIYNYLAEIKGKPGDTAETIGR